MDSAYPALTSLFCPHHSSYLSRPNKNFYLKLYVHENWNALFFKPGKKKKKSNQPATTNKKQRIICFERCSLRFCQNVWFVCSCLSGFTSLLCWICHFFGPFLLSRTLTNFLLIPLLFDFFLNLDFLSISSVWSVGLPCLEQKLPLLLWFVVCNVVQLETG